MTEVVQHTDVYVYGSHSVLASLLHDVPGVLQHLLFPEVKEVRWICVKLQGLLSIVPADNHLFTVYNYNNNAWVLVKVCYLYVIKCLSYVNTK